VPSSLRISLGNPKRPDEIEERVALAQGHHFKGGFAHGLDHHGDRAAIHVEIRDGERDAFAMLIDAGHDEVSGTCRARHIGRFHVPEEGRRTELLSTSDEKHHTPWKNMVAEIRYKILFLSEAVLGVFERDAADEAEDVVPLF
jgi:hypothetical protein